MGALLTINKLTFTDVTDGKHVEIGFKLNAVDIGVLVKFDVVGPCMDTNWWLNPWKHCEPQVRVMKKDIQGYFEKNVTLDYTVTLLLDEPVITVPPSESECKNVQITLKGFYHPSSVPVVAASGKVGGMVGSGSAAGGTVPDLTKDLEFKFCCKDCAFGCTTLTDPVPVAKKDSAAH
jgi:hypothetical protein